MNSPSPTITSHTVGDGLLLYEHRSCRFSVLNSAGRYLWEQLEAGAELPDLVRNFAEHFALPLAQARRDIDTSLSQWHEAGLFTPAEEIVVLPSHPPPFVTEEATTSRRDHEIDFPYSDTFVLAGITLQLNTATPQHRQIFLDILGHLSAEGKKNPELTVYLWREENDYCAELNDRIMRGDDVSSDLVPWILAEFIDKTCRDRDCLAVLHAGALGLGNRAIILAGESGTGKSTFVAGLQQAGFIYLCDDVCPLTPSGELIPVPMSQNIKKGSWTILAESYPELAAGPTFSRKSTATKFVPPRTGSRADWERTWQVDTIVFPQYQGGAATNIAQIDPVSALSLLMNTGSLCGESVPDFIAWVLAKRCYSITYSSLASAAAALKSVLQ